MPKKSSRTLVVALYAGKISDVTLMEATTDPALTSLVKTWMDASREIECRLDAREGEERALRLTGTDGTALSYQAVAALRLALVDGL